LWPSAASFLLLVVLIAAGYTGSRDPLANPLPPWLWTAWWVGLTFLHVVFGNLWAWLNPWRAPYRLLARAMPQPPLVYPAWLGCWPAVILFAAFAWFELVHPSPQDPTLLAQAC